MTDTYELDTFGRSVSSSGSTPNPYPPAAGGAWGYLTDPSGMLQLGARYYWPEVGRFISQDPIGDGVNWYAYASGNPVAFIDPEGLWKMEKHGELADNASAGTCLTPEQKALLHQGAEGPDTGVWKYLNVLGWGTWPHFHEDKSEDLLNKAVKLWKKGKKEKALDTLGWGLHNLADVLVHPKDPFDHKLDPDFTEDPEKRPEEWKEAQKKSADLVGRFVSATQGPGPSAGNGSAGGGGCE